jgi:hypothetical protein
VSEARVTAVQEDDALDLLELLGVAEEYRTGRLRCGVCETPLLENGLGAARKATDGTFQFACARLDCLEEFHST